METSAATCRPGSIAAATRSHRRRGISPRFKHCDCRRTGEAACEPPSCFTRRRTFGDCVRSLCHHRDGTRIWLASSQHGGGGHYAARVDAEMKKAGLVIATADLLIGVTALHHRYAIGTRNVRHFRMIPGLKVVPLQAGKGTEQPLSHGRGSVSHGKSAFGAARVGKRFLAFFSCLPGHICLIRTWAAFDAARSRGTRTKDRPKRGKVDW